jgi:leader peptidase (prepilin peptidase)/N-methyltransferase
MIATASANSSPTRAFRARSETRFAWIASFSAGITLLYNGELPRSAYAGTQGETAILVLAGNIPIWFIAIFVVLIGLAFGSFLNVCISRLPRHESIVHPRSRCPHCAAPIGAGDNIPILSWILLRGRCRHCNQPIAWRYPAVELATAALFLLSFLLFGLTVQGIGMAILSFLLLGLAVMDAETMRLPDAFTLPGIGLGILYSGIAPAFFNLFPDAFAWPWGIVIGFRFSGHPHLAVRVMILGALVSAIWAALAALLLLLIRWIYFLVRHQQGLGMGDVKLIAMIAAWLGPAPTILTLLLGCLAAALFGILSVAASRGKRPLFTTRLPLGSFLCAAALYTIFAGDPIIRWYMRFFS